MKTFWSKAVEGRKEFIDSLHQLNPSEGTQGRIQLMKELEAETMEGHCLLGHSQAQA